MRTIYAALACLLVSAAGAQNNLAVTARLSDVQTGQTVYWQPMEGGPGDSAVTTDGGFSFHRHVGDGEGDGYLLRIGKRLSKGSYLYIYLDKGTVFITGKGPLMTDARLSGTAYARDQTDLSDYLRRDSVMTGAEALYKHAQELYNNRDTAALHALRPDLDRVHTTQTRLSRAWIALHPHSPISAYVLRRDLSYTLDIEEQERILGRLTPAAKNNVPGKAVAHSIAVEKLTGIGRVAPLFTQTDTAGHPVSLHDFRGKYGRVPRPAHR